MSSVDGGAKKGSKKDGVGGGLVCAHCKKSGELDTMKRCGRCHRVSYCSPACQKAHWKRGGHKSVCKLPGSTEPTESGAAVGSEPKFPCPICLSREDLGPLKTGMCQSCGQLFCDDCYTGYMQGKAKQCPCCRVTFSLHDIFKSTSAIQTNRSPGRHTPAVHFSLAQCYRFGRGTSKNLAECERHLRLAANSGHGNAQVMLGQLLDPRNNTESDAPRQDASEAERYYLLAATQGLPDAQFLIGKSYMDGRRGVPPRLVEAERWLRLAADTDARASEARTNLGVLYETGGPGVPRDYTAAAQYYRFGAEKGNPMCQSNYGRLLMKGRGVPQNQRAAVQMYTLAADSGVAPAQHNLAIAYMNGTGVRADLHKARSLLEVAAAQGHGLATMQLGSLNVSGAGGPCDIVEGVRLFEAAGELGQPDAWFHLAQMYSESGSQPLDTEKAMKYMRRAHDERSPAYLQLMEGASP